MFRNIASRIELLLENVLNTQKIYNIPFIVVNFPQTISNCICSRDLRIDIVQLFENKQYEFGT